MSTKMSDWTRVNRAMARIYGRKAEFLMTNGIQTMHVSRIMQRMSAPALARLAAHHYYQAHPELLETPEEIHA